MEFRQDFRQQKTRINGVVCVMWRLAVLVQYGRDVGTDGLTHDDSIYRASIALRGAKQEHSMER